MAVKLSNILNMLTLQAYNNAEEDKGSIDIQFLNILEFITRQFKANKLEIVLDWFHEAVKKEVQLKRKIKENPSIFDKDSIHTLLSKTNALHSKIIELVTDKIDQVGLVATLDNRVIFDLAQTFISDLTIHREINEVIYDNHIKIITQAMEIFNYQAQ